MKQKPTDLKEEMNKSAIRVISVTLWTVTLQRKKNLCIIEELHNTINHLLTDIYRILFKCTWNI